MRQAGFPFSERPLLQLLDNDRGLVCRLYPVAGGDAEHLISHGIGA